MNTEMIAKEPVVKLLQEIKDNLEDMGKAALKGELNAAAVSYSSARLCGKIEQYLEGIDKDGMKSQKELADEECKINLAKAVAVDACANEEYRQLRRAAHERVKKAEAEVQAARKAYKEICEGD